MYFNSKNIFQERRNFKKIPRYKPIKNNSIEKTKNKKKIKKNKNLYV